MSPKRLPLHPPPGPLESLSSWLERIADLYDLPTRKLLTSCLAPPNSQVPEHLDWDPPAELLAAIANRTGTGLEQLTTMTLAGWVPWLMDSLGVRPWQAQETFEVYVRQNSVLLPPGEAGRHGVGEVRSWYGPWLPGRASAPRRCPVCAVTPGQRSWVWDLPLTVGCADHGCWLEDAATVLHKTIVNNDPQPIPVEEPLATLDRYTYEATTVGRVSLPGRQVHAGVWFRLFRSVLDEVSLALTTRRAAARSTLERIWEATGRPLRGGLAVWRPYEQMNWDMQKVMLHAAATAIQLAADGQITPRGTFGSALQPGPHLHVYDGDRPSPPYKSAWQEVMEEAEAAIVLARTDRDAARQLLALLTIGCRTLARFEEERAFLFGIGIPGEFLPTAREFGRDDLA